MEMILLDTNILIEILKGNKDTVKMVEDFSTPVSISSISAMELYYGAINKQEIKKIERFISLFETLHLTKEISLKATHLIKLYAKSHTLDIPDSLIASTAIVHNCKLATYNTKDFRYIDDLVLV
jgi:predicted nucleic acid-binding protein